MSRVAGHTGGVLRVALTPGSWGSVPHALLEDSRLGLDTRAIAAWLTTRPAGWQVIVSHLQRHHGLGEERWRRIAKELELAGYLTRRRSPRGSSMKNGRNYSGTWVWEVIFSPIPAEDEPSIPGSPGHGSPGRGKPGDRSKKDSSKKDSKTPRTGPTAEPVDNPDQETHEHITMGDELEEIGDALGLAKGQLGKLAGICMGQNCKLQDAHRSLAPHIKSKGLQGQQAFLYFKKCLLQNPGRDWTWEARRNVELEAQAEQATQADKARQRFIDRLAQAGDEGIAVRNGGRIFQAPPEENPEVFLTYQKPDGTSFLSRIIDFLNAFPEFLED